MARTPLQVPVEPFIETNSHPVAHDGPGEREIGSGRLGTPKRTRQVRRGCECRIRLGRGAGW